MAEADGKRPRTGTWLRVILGLSLALNLLVIGLAVGAAMRFHGPDRRHPPSIGAALYKALPAEDRAEMRERVRALRDAHREARRGPDVEAIIGALEAEPFSREALSELVSTELQERRGWMEAAHEAWVARIAAMSAEERADYADRLLEVMRAAPEKRGWFGGRD